MHSKLFRFAHGKESTIGAMHLDGSFECYILEDEFRKNKVSGETRIPAGMYDLELREVESPMTLKYRKRFDWFEWHIQIKDVPNFKYCYVHIGNNDDHTDGCLLTGDTANNNQNENGFIGNSTKAYERFYKKVFPLLKAGKRVTLEIVDL